MTYEKISNILKSVPKKSKYIWRIDKYNFYVGTISNKLYDDNFVVTLIDNFGDSVNIYDYEELNSTLIRIKRHLKINKIYEKTI